MPRRPTEAFTIDILIAIETIKRYTKSIRTPSALINNEAAYEIVSRKCTIIGEAMSTIIDDIRLKDFIRPYWRKVVDFRNVITHEYYGLNEDIIFYIVKKEVPVLEKEMIALIKKLPNKNRIQLAITNEIEDLERIGRDESVEYLERLEKKLFKPKKKVKK